MKRIVKAWKSAGVVHGNYEEHILSVEKSTNLKLGQNNRYLRRHARQHHLGRHSELLSLGLLGPFAEERPELGTVPGFSPRLSITYALRSYRRGGNSHGFIVASQRQQK